MRIPSRSRWVPGALAACAVLTGCATYRLGSMLPPDVRTVFVPTFVNRTDQPGIEARATQATIAALQMDGSLRVVPSREQADSVLLVELMGYELTPLIYSEDTSTQTTEYRLTIRAKVALTRHTGAVITEATGVYGEQTFPVIGDMTSSKQAALPGAVEDLGRRIVAGIVESWR